MFVVMVYSLETAKASQVTDGMSDARFPVFDKSGKYLFFAASTDVGLTPGWLNMASMDRPVTRSVYVAVLKKDLPSPLAPESDDEKPKEEEKKADAPKADAKKAGGEKDKAAEKEKPKEPEKVVIDLDGIGQRILALPIPAKNYIALDAGKEGVLFILEGSQVSGATSASPSRPSSTSSTWPRASSTSSWTASTASSCRPRARRSCSTRAGSGPSPGRPGRSSPGRAS